VNAGLIDGRRFVPGVCAPPPHSELLTTHNPICNISAYNGGLLCCGGGSLLLDADQVVPEPSESYQLKYRFYFEEPASRGAAQRNLFRVWWSTEATNNEYDVPQSKADCFDPATPTELCVHTLKSTFTGRDMLDPGRACMVRGDPNACGDVSTIEARGGTFRLLYAAAHCHAPACLSAELWDTDRDVLICRNEPTYGTGASDTHDERGYVVGIPPCVWGDEAAGLRPPLLVHLDANFSSIKRVNSTWGHWGVMALWQMRGSY